MTTPAFNGPAFPDWLADFISRSHRLANTLEVDGYREDRDEKDRYEDQQAIGLLFRPAMRVGDRVVAIRLATVSEAKEWQSLYPEWEDMVCQCGHRRGWHVVQITEDEIRTTMSCTECSCASEEETAHP